MTMPHPDNFDAAAFDREYGVSTPTFWTPHDGASGHGFNVATALQVAERIASLPGGRYARDYDRLIRDLGHALGGESSDRLLKLAMACLVCVEGRGGHEGDMATGIIEAIDGDVSELLEVLS
jgi:hypothetical protein